MPRILILRTFAHTRIWEGTEPTCKYDGKALDLISSWEPGLLRYTLYDVPIALGIYTEMYFRYINRSGSPAYNGSPEEEQISILTPRQIYEGSRSFGTYLARHDFMGIEIAFDFRGKFQGWTRQQMIHFDKNLVRAKREEAGTAATEPTSLCFTLDLTRFIGLLNEPFF